MVGLLSLVLLVAAPIVSALLVYKLFKTRYDGRVSSGEIVTPWSSRIYSAAKRATLAWTAVMLFCVVAVIGVGDARLLPGYGDHWLMVAVPVAAFVWGLAKPRVYTDGFERDKNGRYGAWLMLSIVLFFVFMPFWGTMQMIAWYRSADRSVVEIHAEEWSYWRFRMSPVAPKMIPWAAKDIDFHYTPPAFLGLGGSAEVRCKVEKDDLLAFAKSHGYEFQGESIDRNSCTNGCGDCDFVSSVLHKYNGSIQLPKSFLAYNYRYSTCGGYSFLYDIATKTLYAQWSSN